MELHQVRYFLAVCDQLNFTRAAQNCHTQPSLTRAIQLLEKEFGGFLFHRGRSNIRSTELGRVVKPYLEGVWEQSLAAKAQAKAFTTRTPTQLNIAIMCTVAPKLLTQLFGRYRQIRPNVRLELIDGTAQLIEERLIESQTEAAVYCRPDREADPRLNYLPLFREQMMIVVPPTHRLAGQCSVEIKDLMGKRYVQRASCQFNDMVDSIFDPRGIDCETVYSK
jgi:LysR family hydrogen peroxide-inducible transcriptional activator